MSISEISPNPTKAGARLKRGRPEWAAQEAPELRHGAAPAGAGRCYQQLRRTSDTSGRVASDGNGIHTRWSLRKVQKLVDKCSRDLLHHPNKDSRGRDTDRRVARANPIKDGRGRRPALKTGQTQQKMARGSHAGRPEWAARDDPELTLEGASAGVGRWY